MGMVWGGLSWTDHALGRMKERNVSMETAKLVWNNPDSKRYATAKGAWIYNKDWGKEKIEVVAKQDEKGTWVILSVWSRPMVDGGEKTAVRMPWWLKILRSVVGVK
jgi:hypothetical protein